MLVKVKIKNGKRLAASYKRLAKGKSDALSDEKLMAKNKFSQGHPKAPYSVWRSRCAPMVSKKEGIPLMLPHIVTTFMFVLLLCATVAKAQVQVGVGASGAYNFQTKGFGAGLRVETFVLRSLSILALGTYYPSPNLVHEVYGGIDVHYAPFYHPIVRGYVLAGGSVNYWFNHTESNYKLAKPLNFVAEVGGGLVFLDKQLRPFIEYRYNPFFLEGSLHVGLMYFPKISRKLRYDCPTYN